MALAAAAILFGSVDNARRDARAERDAWGNTVTVWLTTEPVAAGSSLAGSVESTAMPIRLVPNDAMRESPAGERAAVDLGTGEIVRTARLGDASAGPVGSQVDESHRALTLTVDSPVFAVGDQVDLHARSDGALLADAGAVVAVDDRAVTVSISAPQVRAVVAELGRGGVVVVLR